jgi:putative endonuclease
MQTYWVYILASKPYGTLYIGVTNDLLSRLEAHRAGTGSKFTRKYCVKHLVYFEPFADINAAIQREKTLKHHVREWKINLIERENPHWEDLYPALRALPGNQLDETRGPMGPRDKPEDDI